MGHYLRECLNLLTLRTKKNVSFFIWKFSVEDVVDVKAQIKRSVENIIHPIPPKLS